MLADARPEGEIAGERPIKKEPMTFTISVAERKIEAEDPRCGDIGAVAQSAADTGTDEHDRVEHKPPTAADLRL